MHKVSQTLYTDPELAFEELCQSQAGGSQVIGDWSEYTQNHTYRLKISRLLARTAKFQVGKCRIVIRTEIAGFDLSILKTVR